jgi:hypothetical protein
MGIESWLLMTPSSEVARRLDVPADTFRARAEE